LCKQKPKTIYGPDGKNKGPLAPQNGQLHLRIRLPEKKKMRIIFDSNADWENVIQIYEYRIVERTFTLIGERGNHNGETGRTLDPLEIPNATTGSKIIFFTGWHKNGPPNGDLDWERSRVRYACFSDAGSEVDDSVATHGIVAFEDGADQDYNDIVASYYLGPL
jgi:hypothetical protein